MTELQKTIIGLADSFRERDEQVGEGVDLLTKVTDLFNDLSPDEARDYGTVIGPLETVIRRHQTWNAAARRLCAAIRGRID